MSTTTNSKTTASKTTASKTTASPTMVGNVEVPADIATAAKKEAYSTRLEAAGAAIRILEAFDKPVTEVGVAAVSSLAYARGGYNERETATRAREAILAVRAFRGERPANAKAAKNTIVQL